MLTTTLIATTLIAFAFAAASVRRIPEGQVYSVRRLGRAPSLLAAGTHVVLPMIDRVAHKIDLGGQVLRFDGGTVYWQVLEPEAADEVIDDAPELIRSNVVAALRDSSTAHQIDRRAFGTQLKHAVNGSLRSRGMLVTRVELDAA
ncbi:SPFH domain-containing protein [Xanthomonas sp. NCPPB 2632]|jgi:regulator of protease activity HflC (stomatin/prohibitin superfamily)|uniref:SPFH domain-containing protein n=1 Tax=Xanthomonas sp. NCPPB 2632 TaxID=3240912 RepID=UPI003517D96D